MFRNFIAGAMMLALVPAANSFAQAFPSPVSLRAGVMILNAKARKDSVGKTQPALTEEEVVAAIRGWIPEHTPDVNEEVYSRFQKIAETRRLPEGS